MQMNALLTRHPLTVRRKAGPAPADEDTSGDSFLAGAARILEMVDSGKLRSDRPPPIDIPCRSDGRPLKRLTAEQEKDLALRVQTWGDVDARNMLVMANTGLVYMVARSFSKEGLPMADLVQEGLDGLIRATETFEPNRAIRFSTYSVYWINARMQRLRQRTRKTTHVPIEGAGMTVVDGRKIRPKAMLVSLDAPVYAASDDGADGNLSERVSCEGEAPDIAASRGQVSDRMQAAVAHVKAKLGDKRIDVIVNARLLTDGEPLTLSELGDMVNLSREGVRLLEKKFLAELRQYIIDTNNINT